MGIHNEPGFTHLKPYPALPKLVAQMLDSITSSIKQDHERGFLENLKQDGKDEGTLLLCYLRIPPLYFQDEAVDIDGPSTVVLLVNNLGSISQLEMGGIVKEG